MHEQDAEAQLFMLRCSSGWDTLSVGSAFGAFSNRWIP